MGGRGGGEGGGGGSGGGGEGGGGEGEGDGGGLGGSYSPGGRGGGEGGGGGGGGEGAPTSFAVELVWRTHLLSPLHYVHACAVFHAQPVAHQPAHEDAHDEDAHDAPCAATGAVAAAVPAYAGSLEWLGLDLVAAMRRQARFMRGMLAERAAYDSEATLAAAVGEYRAFLDRFHHSEEERVPTALVDLVWHTHMLDPLRYGSETRKLAGRFVNHEDDVTPERLAKAGGA